MIFKLSGLIGLILAAALTVAGHFGADPSLSPWTHTISDFAATDRGGPVESAMGLAALSTLALLPHRRRAVSVLLGTWSAGIGVATIIPTDPVGTALTVSGYIHRYASALAFAALLAASVLLARDSRAVRRLTVAASLGGAAMPASAYLLDRYAIGLTERVLALAGIGMLIHLALRPPPAARISRCRRAAPGRLESAWPC